MPIKGFLPKGLIMEKSRKKWGGDAFVGKKGVFTWVNGIGHCRVKNCKIQNTNWNNSHSGKIYGLYIYKDSSEIYIWVGNYCKTHLKHGIMEHI